MDLHRLEVFLKVVELKSFTKAGEALLLSQPTISEHIRSLEEMVGEKLVDRLGRDLMLTPAGKVLHQYAQRLLHLRDEALQAMAEFRGKLAGRLILGASTIPGTYILPPLVGGFKQHHPDITISLKIASTGEIGAAILKGEYELGLVGFRLPERRLNFVEAFADELVLAVYPDHPWSDKTEVAVSELAGQPFVARQRESGTQMVMHQILASHGVDPHRLATVAEVASTESVRQSIKAKIGIAILSRLAVAEDLEHGTLVVVPLTGVTMHRPFYLCQRQGRRLSPLGQAFGDYLLRAAGRREGPQEDPREAS